MKCNPVLAKVAFAIFLRAFVLGFIVVAQALLLTATASASAFVDASISITPSSATNQVGSAHTFTITVTAIPDGAPPSFATPTVSFVGSPPATVGPVTFVSIVGNVATYRVTINNATAGAFTANASADVTMGAATVTRDTDASTPVSAGPGGSGPATKTFVDASIAIGPSATNPVGVAHTFTITITAFPAGAGTPNFALPTVSFAGTPPGSVGSVTPVSIVGNIATYIVTINNATAGVFTANASANVTMGGVTVTRDTDASTPAPAGPGGSGPAIKTFGPVPDASIALSPLTGTNAVNQHHVVTATVKKDAADGNGLVPAAGVPVVFALSGSTANLSYFDANTDGDNNPLTTTTNANGQALIEFASSTAGSVTINGSTTLSVGGANLTRDTDPTTAPTAGPGGTGPATKLWADAAVRTEIHNASHSPITSANPGYVVHDKAFVEKATGTPAAVPVPTGSVVFHRYATLNCMGPPTDQTVALVAGGTAESNTFTVAGNMSYKAEYLGDAIYPGRLGACEPLTVCGNGILDAGEQCDDSNANNGDGCSSTCTIEPNYECTGLPSVCLQVCPDAFVDLNASATCSVLDTSEGKVNVNHKDATGIGGNACIPQDGSLTIDGAQFVTGKVRLETGAKFKDSSSASFNIVDEGAIGLDNEIADCRAMSTTAAALGCTPANTINKLTNQTLNGTCGLNVYCVKDIDVGDKDVVTITVPAACGTPPRFIINVSGKFTVHGGDQGGKIVAGANVSPEQILYNVIGKGSDVAFSGGGGGTNPNGSLKCCKASVDGSIIAEQRKIHLGPGRVNGILCSEKDIDLSGGSAVCPALFP